MLDVGCGCGKTDNENLERSNSNFSVEHLLFAQMKLSYQISLSRKSWFNLKAFCVTAEQQYISLCVWRVFFFASFSLASRNYIQHRCFVTQVAKTFCWSNIIVFLSQIFVFLPLSLSHSSSLYLYGKYINFAQKYSAKCKVHSN